MKTFSSQTFSSRRRLRERKSDKLSAARIKKAIAVAWSLSDTSRDLMNAFQNVGLSLEDMSQEDVDRYMRDAKFFLKEIKDDMTLIPGQK